MTQQEIQQQEIQTLLQVYQKRVSDLMAQSIAFEARLIVQEKIIISFQEKIEELQSTKRSSTKKINDGDF